MPTHLLVVAVLLSLAACRVRPPSDRTMETVTYGEPPSMEFATTAAKECLRERLTDFDTAKVAFGSLSKDWYRASRSERNRLAWGLEASVDDVNALGMREGARMFRFFYLEEKLVAVAYPGPLEWNGREYRSSYLIEEFDGGGIELKSTAIRPPGGW